MVFEKIVVDLLNRFLGDYVQNLDKNQLKIGIWGGDVVLNNLLLKQSALDELDLPVQTTYGHLGKLSLKIPWKNLYKEPVEATIENLYLLASPNQSVEYNEEKEAKKSLEAKRAELLRIEEAKKKEDEKNEPKIDKGFAEKLATQIINNVQIKIIDIHIRYEDRTSTEKPFAFGVTLKNLSVHTTDSNWQRSFMAEALNRVYKVAELEGLAVYFNSKSTMFSTRPEADYPYLFRETIASREKTPSDFKYILAPISSSARLEINPNPEADEKPFSVPKIILGVGMETLSIGIMKSQYQDLISLVEVMDRMMRGLPYRKYRPYSTPYKGNAKTWWKFAMNSVLSDVRRRGQNWSWNHIFSHRNLCRDYAIAYKTKVQAKKPPTDVVSKCDDCEMKLDLFNLVVIRQKIDLEVKKTEVKKEESQGWFSGWFGRGSSAQDTSSSETDIKKQVQAIMTADEKEKLYKAIGYQENAAPTELPVHFVATKLKFELKKLQILMINDDLSPIDDANRVVSLWLKNVTANLDQRPAAAAIKLNIGIQSFSVLGKQQRGIIPVLAKSKTSSSEESILDIGFETNPLDKRCDQRVEVTSRPLQITYDAQTVIELATMFKPPKNLNISQIQDVAANKLDNIKERSATGLQYMAEKHTMLELNINLMPTFVLIPMGGFYLGDETSMIVIDLGRIKITTEPRKDDSKDVATMHSSGVSADEILQVMINQCYDKFKLDIQEIQVMVVRPKENWQDALLNGIKTEMHLLQPTSVLLSADICVIDDDPRLPKMKIAGELPSIQLTVTEDRLLHAIKIGTSIPLPESDEVEPMALTKAASSLISSSVSIMKFLDDKQRRSTRKTVVGKDALAEEIIQFTDLTVEFVMRELSVSLYKSRTVAETPSEDYRTPIEEMHSTTSFDVHSDRTFVSAISSTDASDSTINYGQKLLDFNVKQFEMAMVQRTYDMKVELKLGAIGLDQFKITGGREVQLDVISTPRFNNDNEYLFSLVYTNAKKDAPEFTTRYNSIQQLIEINFTTLVLLLHQEGLTDVLQLASTFQPKLEAAMGGTKPGQPKDRIATANDQNKLVTAIKESLPTIDEDAELDTEGVVSKRKSDRNKGGSVVDCIQVKVVAKLEKVSVRVACDRRPISTLNIQHLTAGVVMKSSYTEVSINLQDIDVIDQNPLSIHSNILQFVAGDALSCQLVIFNVDETADYNKDNMKVKVNMGCCKIVFMNWFVQSVLSFLDNFQAAQQAIADASAAAADAAKQNMVNAYSNATRIQMNIQIKAPIIIVPVDSQSCDALCLDLGYLSIKNTNNEIPTNNPNNKVAVIDEMKLELKDMKLSKVHILRDSSTVSHVSHQSLDMTDYGLKADVNILNPTSFILHIQRNLSSGWYKERPELNVSGRLKTIELNLIRDDYKMLMDVLSKNMSEGADERKPPPVAPLPPPPPKRSGETPTTPSDDGNAALWKTASKKTFEKPFGLDITPLQSPDEKKKTIDTFLKFSFQMDSIIINLFASPGEGLATFGIHFLSLKGHQLADKSLSTSIVLLDVQLDDIRPNREGKLTRFMNRREDKGKRNENMLVDVTTTEESASTPKSMIDVVFNQRGSDIFLELRVSSFDLILSLDYLLKISNFFQIPEDVKAITTTSQPTPVDQQQIVRKSTSAQPQGAQPPPDEEPKNITVILNVEQPEIILVERMDDINCHALILTSEIGVKFRMIGERQILKGDITDLGLYMCEFNPLRRELTKHFVLHPCALSLNGSTPEGKGLNISLQVTTIKLCVSPAIIEILNKALVTLTTQEKSELEADVPPPDFSAIWNPDEYCENDFWFMKTVEVAEDVLSTDLTVVAHKEELCVAEIPSIILIIETGVGHQTIPMLFIETSMNAKIHNWSWAMAIESSLQLQMSYYNSSLALWEPLIEPNERRSASGLIDYGPWELTFSMEVVKNTDESGVEDDEPTTKVSIQSKSILEMTVTKTCLDILQSLGNAFSEAIKSEGLVKPVVDAPYVVQNDTGFEVTLLLSKGAFVLHNSHLPNSGYSIDEHASRTVVFQADRKPDAGADLQPTDVTLARISPGGKAYLQLRPEYDSESIQNVSFSSSEKLIKEKGLHVQIGEIDKELVLPVQKADERFFPLYRDTNREPWGIVSDINVEYGSTVITLHGILQVFNHFTAPITMYRMKENTPTLIGEIAPNTMFNVPLHAIYSTIKEIHFSMQGYKMSIQGISWKENPSDFNMIRSLQCDPITTFEPFYMNAVRERKEIFHEVTSKFTMLSACYIVHLRPPLILKNTLPIGLLVSVAGCSVAVKDSPDAEVAPDDAMKLSKKEDFLDYGEKMVQPGEALHLPTVKTASRNETPSYIVARLVQYLEKDWSCTTEIPSNPAEFVVWTFNSYDSVEKMSLELGVRYENRHGTLILSLYCPFWMVNKTGLMLSYRKSRKTEKNELSGNSTKPSDESTNILYHPPDYNGPILFSFREKQFFGKKKASIRVETGEWSDKFSLDVAGSSGVVECKANSITYQIAVHNTLTHNSLTKQIMFMPYYILLNKSPFSIEVQEDQRPADPWLTVNPDDSIPFWPKNLANKMMRVKTVDEADVARSFNYTDVQDTLLKLDNKYGGIHVDVHVTEGGIFITFNGYYPGDAPALLFNHTDQDISFWEKGNVNERILPRKKKMLYTWSDPAGERKILWNDQGKNQIEYDLKRDGIETFTLAGRNAETKTFWVSFLDGTQRVLLFTDNECTARGAESMGHLDKVTQEVLIDIQGIGLSLVNNVKQCDVMYIGIASTNTIWEEEKKGRWKAMKISEVQMMEEKYQEFLRDTAIGQYRQYTIDNEKILVDFNEMTIKKSNFRKIRRTFYPGLWLQMKTSPYQSQIHAKINRIQIDNQTADCIFPVVLAPVPPPKSVAATTELKPFIECSIVQRVIPHSDVKQFKYARVLMQEFHVKVDLMFVNELFEFLNAEVSDEESAKQFALDLKHLEEPLSAHVQVHTQQEQKNFYDELHLGPLKIHVSFSMAGSESKALPGILSTILQGVGVTLTDVNDVVFRLAFFERNYCFLTQRQLVSECVSHYSGQAVKQLYVLVLGLDVIGNPYGLVVGFTKGVEDLFYEPFQGAIQGPGEFAEGLVLGVRSLFGHTVGGAAGAVSKITGAMGKGIAVLTFDKDYQKKRRDQMNKKPANLQEGLARSGKGLVMGVVDGVTGVITKPISGARSEGFGGFMKGLGKGAVGLVARPTAGIVDFASGSFEAVKRATELDEDVNRLRPPRFLHSDGVVRPYNVKEAEGNKLLKDIEKGKYSNTDTFAHLEEIIEKKELVLLSDHRVLYLTKNDLFGGWQIDWTYRWDEVTVITVKDRGVEITLHGKDGKKKLGLFSSSSANQKLILIPHRGKRENVAQIMKELKSKHNN